VAYPGPRIDYLRECMRWFGRWLADEKTGVQDEPPIALYVQQYRPPQPTVVDAPGYWRAERDWPLPGATTRTLYLGAGDLAEGPPADEGRDALEYLATVGMAAPLACMGGASPSMQPTDQRADDAWSLVYTSAPLESDLEVVGYPTVVLHAGATAEVAFFSVKLCDVAPDSRSTFVTRGLLNATRRDSLREPEPLVPGRVYELRIELDCCAWVFPAGHRLRLAVAGSDWPNIWPAPLPSTHAIYHGPEHPSRLELPVAPPATGPAPQFAPPPELITLSPVESSGGALRVIENVHEQTVTVHRESGLRRAIMPYDATELTDAGNGAAGGDGDRAGDRPGDCLRHPGGAGRGWAPRPGRDGPGGAGRLAAGLLSRPCVLYLIAFKLNLLPLGGYGDPVILYLILPAATQGVPAASGTHASCGRAWWERCTRITCGRRAARGCRSGWWCCGTHCRMRSCR
jgi:hypothetical protein